MNVILPEINAENNRCIYKFSFEDGSFYIGKSSNFKERVYNYKRQFNNPVQLNKKVSELALLFNEAKFEIIELVPLNKDLKERETYHIRNHTFDSKFLNSKKYFV